MKWIIISVGIAISLGILAMLVLVQAEHSKADIPVLGQLSDFTLTERSGESFTRDNLIGKLTVVDFIFTSCQGPCPIMGTTMAELYQQFEGTSRIQFLSISVDPERDSLETLREYATSLGVTDNRWLFTRGPLDSITQLCEGQFMLAAENLPGGHTTKFILVDDQAQIRRYYTSLDEKSIRALKRDLKLLVDKIK